MERLVCLLALNLLLVRGIPVRENHGTSRPPVANVSSTLPVKEQVVQTGAQNHGNQARNVLTQGNRTIRDVGCQTDDFYPTDYLCCRKCPAGTRVAKHCTETNTSGKCEACTDGEDYTKWKNGLDKCLPCTSCREDQETVSRCTARRDSVCQCRAATFCSPDQTCEMCQKCTRCPEGQAVKQECTPKADTVCERTESPAATLSGGYIAAIVIVIVIVPVIVLLLILYRTGCCRQTGCKAQRRVILSMIKCLHRTDSEDSGSDVVKKEVNESRSAAGGGGEAALSAASEKIDNDVNEQAQNEKATLLHDSPEASARYRDEPFLQSPCHGGIGAGSSSELGQRGLADPNDLLSCLNLNSLHDCGATDAAMSGAVGTSFVENVSAPSSIPYKPTVNIDRGFQLVNELSDEGLRQSFSVFIKEVPIKSWKEFMRKLHLTENEIVEAERNNINNITEGHYQMLHTWHQKSGRAASVKTLLTILCDMDLRAAAHTIHQTLANRETEEH